MDVGADQPFPYAEEPAWTWLPGGATAHLRVEGMGDAQLAAFTKKTSPHAHSESAGLEHVIVFHVIIYKY